MEEKKQKSVIPNYLEMMLKFNEAFYEKGWRKKCFEQEKAFSRKREKKKEEGKTLLIKVDIENFSSFYH